VRPRSSWLRPLSAAVAPTITVMVPTRSAVLIFGGCSKAPIVAKVDRLKPSRILILRTPPSIVYIRAGKLRALAVTTAMRSRADVRYEG